MPVTAKFVLGHDEPLESDRGIANVGERDWGAPSNAPEHTRKRERECERGTNHDCHN